MPCENHTVVSFRSCVWCEFCSFTWSRLDCKKVKRKVDEKQNDNNIGLTTTFANRYDSWVKTGLIFYLPLEVGRIPKIPSRNYSSLHCYQISTFIPFYPRYVPLPLTTEKLSKWSCPSSSFSSCTNLPLPTSLTLCADPTSPPPPPLPLPSPLWKVPGLPAHVAPTSNGSRRKKNQMSSYISSNMYRVTELMLWDTHLCIQMFW